MGDWPNWAGDLPSWITCAAVVFAGSQYFADRAWRKRAQQRDDRRQALEICGWVVFDQNPPKTYGVVISNTSRSTFHDVIIRAAIHGAEVSTSIVVLPPGQFYVQYNGRGRSDGRFEWNFPIPAEAYGRLLRPITASSKYVVRSLAFTDSADKRWASDEHCVVSEVRGG